MSKSALCVVLICLFVYAWALRSDSEPTTVSYAALAFIVSLLFWLISVVFRNPPKEDPDRQDEPGGPWLS